MLRPWCLMVSLVLLSLAGRAVALQLPSPISLAKDASLRSQTVEVIEPHATTPERPVRIAYVGVPMREALTRWFGESWQRPGTEVVFLAEDGYASAIPAEKLARQPAYLTYARADGAPFELDNWEQRERVPLAPYYLVWDNLRVPALQHDGSSGWPYQVTHIRLRQPGDDAALRLPHADLETALGLKDTVTNCLTCHHLRGFGGEKFHEDLSVSLCRWPDAELVRWMLEPSRFRPGTSMPALNRAWPDEERRLVAHRIARYLDGVRRSDPRICARDAGKPH